MEETDIKTGKIGWTYGLIAGLISVVFSLMIYFMDMTITVIENPISQIIGPIIIIVVMIIGVIAYKKANDGYIKIGQALKVACGIGLIAGIIGILYGLIIGMIDPELIETVSEYLKEKTFAQNPNMKMTDEQWETGMKIQTYVGYAASIILPIILGLIVGGITGAIVQNKRPE